MLALSFLGTFDARWNDEPIKGFESGKVRALLAYLVVEAGKPHSRDHLAGMFWAEASDEIAARNLRQALSNLRKVIRDDGASPLINATYVSVQAKPGARLRLDVDEFTALLAACEAHPHRRIETCVSCAMRRQKALALYRGGFLEGFFLKEANVFQDWLIAKREVFHQMAADALQALIAFHRHRGETKPGIEYAQRLLKLDLWREEAHVELIRLLAQDGQRSAALKQYEECRNILAKELGIEPQNETRELYERIKSNDLPMEASVPAPDNLPQEITTFVGRQPELEQIADLLQRTDSRLVTLTGLGGVGKTRLALRAARQQTFAFQDGTFWFPLAELTDASTLPSLLAETIGFHFSSTENPRRQLLEYLKPKETLLVLDNFEHLLTASGFLSDLLQTCPQVTLLITSREPLRLQTEWVFDVNGLDASLPPLEPDSVISSSDSLRLFEERARRVRHDFSLTDETAPQVRDLCQLLNGLPLGIEIAAALCGRFTLTEIRTRIHQSLDFLTITARDLPERHRSLRSVFDQSWGLLERELQAILARLSVFRGGFSLHAAQEVSLATADQLAALVDKSLLAFDGKETYSLHELVRQYCAESLQESAEAEEVSTRFINYFAGFVSDREPRLYTEDQKNAIQEIETNFHHIREAWSLAGKKRLTDALNRMFGGVHFYLDLRGQLLVSWERTWQIDRQEVQETGVQRDRHVRKSGEPEQLPGEKDRILAWAPLHYTKRRQA